MPAGKLSDVSAVYQGLNKARKIVHAGVTGASAVIDFLYAYYKESIHEFEVRYVAVVNVHDFQPLAEITLPFIMHVCISDGATTHFDGLLILEKKDLADGPRTIWV
jgi:pantothenate synthetase